MDAAATQPLSSYEGACAAAGHGREVRDVLARVGDKWTLLVVSTLRSGTLRFSELQRHIPGISQRMLTLTLRQLERDGLVSRVVHAEVPPRVEYTLTDLGTTLLELAIGMGDWAIHNRARIEAARSTYDARESGTVVASTR